MGTPQKPKTGPPYNEEQESQIKSVTKAALEVVHLSFVIDSFCEINRTCRAAGQVWSSEELLMLQNSPGPLREEIIELGKVMDNDWLFEQFCKANNYPMIVGDVAGHCFAHAALNIGMDRYVWMLYGIDPFDPRKSEIWRDRYPRNFAEAPPIISAQQIEEFADEIADEMQILTPFDPGQAHIQGVKELQRVLGRVPSQLVKEEYPINRPSENAFKAWRLRDLTGINDQTKIAEEMEKQGISATQGQVSRWLGQVEDYLEAGNVLPTIDPLTSQPNSIDPNILDMGKRQDGRTPRQRDRRNPD